jgi:hypothetical protein
MEEGIVSGQAYRFGEWRAERDRETADRLQRRAQRETSGAGHE